MTPKYQINNFINDCMIGTSKVSVLKNAAETAKLEFNLNTQEQIVGFIGNGGLELPCFINCTPWKNNPNPNNQIMVDAYGFYSGFVYGYIAFFFQQKTGKWIIKSFKKNSEPDTRNPAFRIALSKL